MISVHPTFFYLLLEALAAVTALALLLGLVLLRRRRHRRGTLMDLVQRIKNAGEARREGITRVLQESGVSDDERLAALTQQVLTAETHFYQFLVRALLSNDDRALLDLDRQVEILTDAITRCSPALKHQAAAFQDSNPAMPAEIHAELGQIKQVVAALQTSHQQALAEVKSSVTSVRDALQQFAGQGVIAVAAAGSTVSFAAPPPADDGTSTPALAQDALESLPDIDDTANPTPAVTTPSPAAASAPPPSAPQAPDIDQIAEIPDELLMGANEASATTAPAKAAEAAPTLAMAGVSAELEAPGAAAAGQASAAAEPAPAIAAEVLSEKRASAAPAPEADASTSAAPNAYPSDAAALIDDLLANAAATSKATLASTQAAAPAAAEENSGAAAELSVDEIYAAAPLIPDSDEQPASASAAQTSTPPREPSLEAGKAQQEAGQSKNYGNVDDLLAELDDLLK